MAALKRCGWLVLVLIITTAIGCNGVLFESKKDDGKLVERLRVDGGESWETFDDKPRNPYKDGKKLDDMSIMLKQETNF